MLLQCVVFRPAEFLYFTAICGKKLSSSSDVKVLIVGDQVLQNTVEKPADFQSLNNSAC